MRCGGLELVRAKIRERTEGAIPDTVNSTEKYIPFAVTYGQREEQRSMFGKKVRSAAPEFTKPYGRLEAWICRSCGFVEWYAQSPEEIPIAEAFGTELVTVPAPAYRR
jgi:hypothetical protein